MGSGSTLKFALCEVLQFVGLCVPLFIIMQRFAVIVAKVKASAQPPSDSSMIYWLIVASSIAYVTSTALLIWVPLKYMVFARKKFLVGRKKWRPVALVYVILSTLPCFAFLIASSEVQINNNMKHDTFTELPVSLVIFSLICIDVVERIRHCRLTGQASEIRGNAEIPSIVLTRVEPMTPVSPITPAGPDVSGSAVSGPSMPGPSMPGSTIPGPAVPSSGGSRQTMHGQGVPNPLEPRASLLNNRSQNGAGIRPETNGAFPGIAVTSSMPFSISELSSPPMSDPVHHVSPYTYRGPLRFLCVSDARADVFVDSFMFWMDTVEMVRVAGHPSVYYSGWVFPIYIFSYISCLRVVIMPSTPLLSSLGVVLQDLPFFFMRVGLIAFFGFVTPVLYLMKNMLVCLAFVYFNFMTKLRIFNTERMFI